MCTAVVCASIMVYVKLKYLTSLMNSFKIESESEYLFIFHKGKSQICSFICNLSSYFILRKRKVSFFDSYETVDIWPDLCSAEKIQLIR